jgi:hypothetical protein
VPGCDDGRRTDRLPPAPGHAPFTGVHPPAPSLMTWTGNTFRFGGFRITYGSIIMLLLFAFFF